jgi:acyl-CoA dehydrogenase
VNEQRALLESTVGRLFPELAASARAGDSAQEFGARWATVSDLGLSALLLPEEAGGFGGLWQDAFVVLHAAGFHALPLPVAETIVAHGMVHALPLELPAGAITLAPVTRTGEGWLAKAVPWGTGEATLLSACADEEGEWLVLFDTAAASSRVPRDGPASEPRSDLRFGPAAWRARCRRDGAVAELFARGALMRVAQMAGALDAALAMTLAYVNERVQFGRTLGKFQVVQHQLALLAEEAAAVGCGAQAACAALDRGADDLAVAAAKLRANRAVHPATSIAHQLHGAIGFTREHALHHLTQRLWRWRSDFGNDRYWATCLGQRVTRTGADGLWDLLTR